MTDNRHDDSHLDAAIDRAVRDLMSAEPRAGLRERVLAELTGEPAGAAWWPRLAVVTAALATIVVIALTFSHRPAERHDEQTVASALPRAISRPTPPAAGAPDVTTPPPTTALIPLDERGARARTPAVQDRPVQAASIDTSEPIAIEPMTAVERLAPIDPIRIARLESPTVPDVSLKPITIERIEITPLTPPPPQR